MAAMNQAYDQGGGAYADIADVPAPRPLPGYLCATKEKPKELEVIERLLKGLIASLVLSAVLIFGGLIVNAFVLKGSSIVSTTDNQSPNVGRTTNPSSFDQVLQHIQQLKDEIQLLKVSNLSLTLSLSQQQFRTEKLEQDMAMIRNEATRWKNINTTLHLQTLDNENKIKKQNTRLTSLLNKQDSLEDNIKDLTFKTAENKLFFQKQDMKIIQLNSSNIKISTQLPELKELLKHSNFTTSSTLYSKLTESISNLKNKVQQMNNQLLSNSSAIKGLISNNQHIQSSLEKQMNQISFLNTSDLNILTHLSAMNIIVPNSQVISTSIKYCTRNVPATVCMPCLCASYDKILNGYTCDCRNIGAKRDYREFYENGYRIDGIYMLSLDKETNISAYCDQSDRDGGWTVIQRRFDGSTGFYRSWGEYRDGFGELKREYYLGNKHIHLLTKSASKVRIDMETTKGTKYYAIYNHFSVSNEDQGFKLSIASYSGDAGDGMAYHDGMKFTTFDKDNDVDSSRNCASRYLGGWWYKSCLEACLNGVYHIYDSSGLYYYGRSALTLKKSSIKVKRKN